MLEDDVEVVSHANVYNTALQILRNKGFHLSLTDEWLDASKFKETWHATKGNLQLHADNPIELLGLAAIYEFKGEPSDLPPYWWYVESPDIWTELRAEYAESDLKRPYSDEEDSEDE